MLCSEIGKVNYPKQRALDRPYFDSESQQKQSLRQTNVADFVSTLGIKKIKRNRL